MYSRLEEVARRFEELSIKLSDPSVIHHREEFQKISKEHSDLCELMEVYAEYKNIEKRLKENRDLVADSDAEISAMANEELPDLEKARSVLEDQLKLLLLPKDSNDGKNVFLEIRAGTGGDEAGLFAAELLRLYLKYAERQRWKTEIMSINETGLGGLKEAIVLLEGKNAYSHLKYEGGVHRVQRVPVTEGSGRIHTSAVTVAVLPEAQEVEVKIDDKDLRIDVMRAGGPGGQSVNTTDSAVRVTHIPTGLIVICQDEKSQHKNKAKALRVLRARLLEREQEKQKAEISAARKTMVGSGDRSERIRTYNFPQNRVTDHRIGLTLHKLAQVMEGDLDQLVAELQNHHAQELLRLGPVE